MSQKHCGRTFLNPIGNVKCPSVFAGNMMVARMILLSLYHLSKLSVFLLEQPGTSKMRQHPYWEYLERAALDVKKLQGVELAEFEKGLEDIPSWMASFGGETPKRSTLSGTNRRVLFPLFRTLDKKTRAGLTKAVVSERYVVEDGQMKHKVTGIKNDLKATQRYPAEYGRAVGKAYSEWLSTREQSIDSSSESDYEERAPNWPHAHLRPVFSFLSKKTPRVRSFR